MKKILGLVVLGGLVIAALGFFAANTVFAQGLNGLGNPGNPGMRGGQLGKYMEQATADVFGMTVAELQAAQKDGKTILDIAADKGWTVKDLQTKMQEVRTKAIDLALAAGDITQAQADWMKSNTGKGMGMGGKRGGMMWGGGYLHDEMISAMAGVLGIDAKDLETRLTAGEKLTDIATKQGISQQDWPAKMKEAMTTAINKAVVDGKLTQAQADLMLKRLENRAGGRFGNGTPPANGPSDETSMGPAGDGRMGMDDILSF